MSYRLSIALFGKGSTNHLHRKEVVEEFLRKNIKVRFLVREDYLPLLNRIHGCDYSSISIAPPVGWRAVVLWNFEYIRSLFPSRDIGRRAMFDLSLYECPTIPSRIFRHLCRFLARYRWIVHFILRLEGFFFDPDSVKGIAPDSMDQLMLLGVGTVNSESEGILTWWAQRYHIPIVHIVGNYDNLSSKGYRGVPITRLLIWGPNMRDDAINLQGINLERISEIGSLRYNTNLKIEIPPKELFIKSIGLDPDKKTILFAGFVFEYHYYEILEIQRELIRKGEACQLILRIYPNKELLNSVYMKSLLDYAQTLPDVYISLADPDYRSGDKNKEVIQIEENELWAALKWCDLVINFYSTIAIEACMFDKSVLNIYFPPSSVFYVRPPIYRNYSLHFHNRRLASYGAITTAKNREDLIAMIRDSFAHPEKRSTERQLTVAKECGVLDGKACERLVECCYQEWQKKSKPYETFL